MFDLSLHTSFLASFHRVTEVQLGHQMEGEEQGEVLEHKVLGGGGGASQPGRGEAWDRGGTWAGQEDEPDVSDGCATEKSSSVACYGVLLTGVCCVVRDVLTLIGPVVSSSTVGSQGPSPF